MVWRQQHVGDLEERSHALVIEETRKDDAGISGGVGAIGLLQVAAAGEHEADVDLAAQTLHGVDERREWPRRRHRAGEYAVEGVFPQAALAPLGDVLLQRRR